MAMRIRISGSHTGALQRIVRTNVCNLRRNEPACVWADRSRVYFQVFLQNMRLRGTS